MGAVLDEFGAVIRTATDRAVASLQRGRSHDGQINVVTQSAADVEALTGQTGLLASLTDNSPRSSRTAKPLRNPATGSRHSSEQGRCGSTPTRQPDTAPNTPDKGAPAASGSSASAQTPSGCCTAEKQSSTRRSPANPPAHMSCQSTSGPTDPMHRHWRGAPRLRDQSPPRRPSFKRMPETPPFVDDDDPGDL